MVVLGVLQGKRCRTLQNAAQHFPLIELEVCDYQQAIASPEWLVERLMQADAIKIDSPGEDTQVQLALAQQGWKQNATKRAIPCELRFGELAPSADWYAGFAAFLRWLAEQTHGANALWLNSVESILLMTDKWLCQQHFAQHQISVPRLLGRLQHSDELGALLDAHGMDQVFIKSRYGSSASGVIAYRRNRRGQQQAASTLMMSEDGAFNTKKLSHYKHDKDILRLLDTVIEHEAYVEAWVPKPFISQAAGRRHYDLRVVALGGQAQHRIARASEQVMTNLHLDSERVSLDQLMACDEAALEETVVHAARTFPDAHCLGFDIISRGVHNRVLEANAFGDLLPGLDWNGQGDTYHAQLNYLQQRMNGIYSCAT